MKKLLFVLLVLGCVHPVLAQDMAAMAKWTETKVVQYRAVGEFSGTVNVLAFGVSVRALVTDRVEIDFDWNQEENKLVGKPVIKNFPSKAGAPAPQAECPAAKVAGVFEFITVLNLKDQPDEMMRMASAGVIVEGKRDYPAGEAPQMSNRAAAPCGSTWEKLAAKSEPTSEGLGVPLAMMLAMGRAGGDNISPDGKSFVNKYSDGSHAGWTWTFTPTPPK